MRHARLDKAVIVYDGACGFCRRAVAAIERRDPADQFDYVPRQTTGIEERFPELKFGHFGAGMRLFEPDGKMHIGADAIYRITLRLPYFRWFSWTYRIPLLNGAVRLVYSWIAANRLKLSRYCGDECALNAAEERASESDRASAMSRRQIGISIAILLIVGLHGWANAAKAFTRASWMGDRSWPFLAYGMYRESYRPAVIRATKEHVAALTAAGHELKMLPEVVGLHGHALHQHYIGPMHSGDPTAARLLADRINLGRSDPVVAFRIDSETYVITNTGVVSEGKQSVTYSNAN